MHSVADELGADAGMKRLQLNMFDSYFELLYLLNSNAKEHVFFTFYVKTLIVLRIRSLLHKTKVIDDIGE